MKDGVRNIMKFTTDNGTMVEYINMNEFTDVQYYPEKNAIIFQRFVNDKPHTQTRLKVDKESVCLL